MTETQTGKSVIIGTFIVYVIKELLDKTQHSNGSTILLLQCLRAKLANPIYMKYVQASNDVWINVVNRFKDDNYSIVIFDIVEFLYYDEEEAMTLMYGKKLGDLVARFSLKQTMDGIDNDKLRQSRIVSKALIDETRKVLFDIKDK